MFVHFDINFTFEIPSNRFQGWFGCVNIYIFWNDKVCLSIENTLKKSFTSLDFNSKCEMWYCDIVMCILYDILSFVVKSKRYNVWSFDDLFTSWWKFKGIFDVFFEIYGKTMEMKMLCFWSQKWISKYIETYIFKMCFNPSKSLNIKQHNMYKFSMHFNE